MVTVASWVEPVKMSLSLVGSQHLPRKPCTKAEKQTFQGASSPTLLLVVRGPRKKQCGCHQTTHRLKLGVYAPLRNDQG